MILLEIIDSYRHGANAQVECEHCGHIATIYWSTSEAYQRETVPHIKCDQCKRCTGNKR